MLLLSPCFDVEGSVVFATSFSQFLFLRGFVYTLVWLFVLSLLVIVLTLTPPVYDIYIYIFMKQQGTTSVKGFQICGHRTSCSSRGRRRQGG